MISVSQADQIISGVSLNFQTEKVALEQSVGRVLAQDILADRDFPPFNRVSMDGIAINFEAFKSGQRSFPVQAIQAAGSPQLSLNAKGDCIEVMTGAVAPQNTDTIIRYEDVEIKDGVATILIEDVRDGQNNHKQGTDRKQGELIINKQVRISPAEIGVIASVGYTHVEVVKNPKIAIISTGEELVEVGDTPLPHQIRKSNVHTVHSALIQRGIEATLFHLPDHKERIIEKLKEILDSHEILILSGGVSKGKYDYLPSAFEELAVKKLFHKIEQRPGKPFWFGVRNDKKVLFSFPGNPVSTFMCLTRYFFPWLDKQMGISPKKMSAILQSDFSFKPSLQYFLQVKTEYRNGQLLAAPVAGRGSGDLANLVEADGFLELPSDKQNFAAGQEFPYHPYR